MTRICRIRLACEGRTVIATRLTGEGDMTARSTPLIFLVSLFTLSRYRLADVISLHTVTTTLWNRNINVFHDNYAAGRKQGHRFEEDGVGQTFGRKRHTVDLEVEGTGTGVNQTGFARAGSTCTCKKRISVSPIWRWQDAQSSNEP